MLVSMAHSIDDIFAIYKSANAFEVLRTIYFDLECTSGVRSLKLELVQRPQQPLYEVHVWSEVPEGWKRESSYEQPTLKRDDPRNALTSMVGYLNQHMIPY